MNIDVGISSIEELPESKSSIFEYPTLKEDIGLLKKASFNILRTILRKCNLEPKFEILRKRNASKSYYIIKATVGTLETVGSNTNKRKARHVALVNLLQTLLRDETAPDRDIGFCDSDDVLCAICEDSNWPRPFHSVCEIRNSSKFKMLAKCHVGVTVISIVGTIPELSRALTSFKMLFHLLITTYMEFESHSDDCIREITTLAKENASDSEVQLACPNSVYADNREKKKRRKRPQRSSIDGQKNRHFEKIKSNPNENPLRSTRGCSETKLQIYRNENSDRECTCGTLGNQVLQNVTSLNTRSTPPIDSESNDHPIASEDAVAQKHQTENQDNNHTQDTQTNETLIGKESMEPPAEITCLLKDYFEDQSEDKEAIIQIDTKMQHTVYQKIEHGNSLISAGRKHFSEKKNMVPVSASPKRSKSVENVHWTHSSKASDAIAPLKNIITEDEAGLSVEVVEVIPCTETQKHTTDENSDVCTSLSTECGYLSIGPTNMNVTTSNNYSLHEKSKMLEKEKIIGQQLNMTTERDDPAWMKPSENESTVAEDLSKSSDVAVASNTLIKRNMKANSGSDEGYETDNQNKGLDVFWTRKIEVSSKNESDYTLRVMKMDLAIANGKKGEHLGLFGDSLIFKEDQMRKLVDAETSNAVGIKHDEMKKINFSEAFMRLNLAPVIMCGDSPTLETENEMIRTEHSPTNAHLPSSIWNETVPERRMSCRSLMISHYHRLDCRKNSVGALNSNKTKVAKLKTLPRKPVMVQPYKYVRRINEAKIWPKMKHSFQNNVETTDNFLQRIMRTYNNTAYQILPLDTFDSLNGAIAKGKSCKQLDFTEETSAECQSHKKTSEVDKLLIEIDRILERITRIPQQRSDINPDYNSTKEYKIRENSPFSFSEDYADDFLMRASRGVVDSDSDDLIPPSKKSSHLLLNPLVMKRSQLEEPLVKDQTSDTVLRTSNSDISLSLTESSSLTNTAELTEEMLLMNAADLNGHSISNESLETNAQSMDTLGPAGDVLPSTRQVPTTSRDLDHNDRGDATARGWRSSMSGIFQLLMIFVVFIEVSLGFLFIFTDNVGMRDFLLSLTEALMVIILSRFA